MAAVAPLTLLPRFGVIMNTSTLPPRTATAGDKDQHKGSITKPGWFLVSPSVLLLLVWMIVPLGMTIYFSLIG